ncbi:MAG TPA: TatD family nuclease-associated radical SAM protein, partial [Megamonas hypermegale]|nr:TatD family nuclease-associated radical SAM protein [Megamonas hypermegale]
IKMYPTEKFNMYVNITNRCNCNCTFCLRHLKEDHKLWLKDGEPSVEEIKQAFLNAPMDNVKEIVICGFGEPTIRLDDLIKVLKFIREKYPQMKVRTNTNGLSDLEFGKSTALMFEGLLDTISISLNESTAQKYLDVTRSRFGIKSYNAMLEFASQCKKYIPNVVVTIVDIIGEAEIAACKKVCEQYGLNLRIRKYEKN